MIRLIVCAAIRGKESGVVICGPRHGDCLNQRGHLGLKDREWECGFVDQDNKFLTRYQAWKVADAAGQIRRPLGWERHYNDVRQPNVGDDGLLFSENLY